MLCWLKRCLFAEGFAHPRAMAAAQHVLKEICDASSQKDLQKCRRMLSYVHCSERSTRRESLTDQLLELSQDPQRHKLICTELLAGWQRWRLLNLLRKLRTSGCEVTFSGQRNDDLAKPIIDVKEYKPRQDAAAAAAASSAEGPSISKGTCPNSFPPAPPGVQAVTEMTMVAVDTSADPVKQKRKLCRTWQSSPCRKRH